MTDLRQAATQALEALEHCCFSDVVTDKDVAADAILALRTALEQQAEPVAFYVYKPTLPRGNLGSVADGDLPWVYDQDPLSGYVARMRVYTTPLQRPWQGLTDEEILSTDPRFGKSESDVNPYQILGSARDLEAKLKERNT